MNKMNFEERVWYFWDWCLRDRAMATRQAKREEAEYPGLCVTLKNALAVWEKVCNDPVKETTDENLAQIPKRPRGVPLARPVKVERKAAPRSRA